MRTRSKILLGLLIAGSLAIAVPLIAFRLSYPFQYNQFLVAQVNLSHGKLRPAEWADAAHSGWSAGLHLLTGGGESEEPPLDQPERVFAYVFSWLPPHCVVYPTEGFYYFATEIGGRRIMGNVRVADLEKGKLGSAYFTVPEKDTWSWSAGAEQGLTVERRSWNDHVVTYRGKSVRFVGPEWGSIPPERLALLPEESFVGQVYDESAVQFFLVFNEATSSFYFMLNEEDGLNETLESISDDVLVGLRTGFAFYVDEKLDRKLFLGGALEHANRNDYFDGPQDQVPYHLNLRDRLNRAYPNTLKGDGIDEHGVYLNKPEWLRIAITPFMRYAQTSELPKRVAACSDETSHGAKMTRLTKEWWNTPAWLAKVHKELAAEGKLTDAPR